MDLVYSVQKSMSSTSAVYKKVTKFHLSKEKLPKKLKNLNTRSQTFVFYSKERIISLI